MAASPPPGAEDRKSQQPSQEEVSASHPVPGAPSGSDMVASEGQDRVPPQGFMSETVVRGWLLFFMAFFALLAIAGVVWVDWLVTSRPSVGEYSDGRSMSCYGVFELPNPAATTSGQYRDVDDQFFLNMSSTLRRNSYVDSSSELRRADACTRARTARLATAAVVVTPLALVALAVSVAYGVALRRRSRDNITTGEHRWWQSHPNIQ